MFPIVPHENKRNRQSTLIYDEDGKQLYYWVKILQADCQWMTRHIIIFPIISSPSRASFLIFHLLLLQEAYAQFVKDYYIKKMETPPSSYDREYLKETTPDDSSKWCSTCFL